ncbi:MAG TPA: pitrilysin family protein [Kofleriaceae bacterium]|nr:pitrilysin family protein [Kofleriaceae bacterium]
MRALAIVALLALPAAAAPNPAFDTSGIADWTKPPAPGAEPTFTPPVARRMKLANGMAVLVVENHALPIVAMTLVVPGAGTAADPGGKGGLAAFTADMLDEGAGGLTAIQIAEEQDRLGAEIGLYAESDAALVTVHTLTKTLDPTLALVAKIVAQPAFAPADFERVKGDRLTALELRRDRPREVASIMLGAALYGIQSPYGHPGGGVHDEFARLTADDVAAFYRAHWNPAAMTLVVAGDVDPAALRAKLEAGLGAWKPAGVVRPARPVATPARIAHRLWLVDRAGAAQSDVRIGLVGPDRHDRRYYAFEVLTSTLGGGFTSRLVQRLREQLGITYGAGAYMEWSVAPGPFVISTAIQTPSTAQGIAETMKILDDLAARDLPAAELDKSKHNLIRALPARFETNAATSEAFAELALLGLPDDFYAHYAAAIRGVSAADVKAAARALIPSGRMVIAVVGDMSKVRADLDKLGFGVPELRDLYGMPMVTK